MQDKHLRTRQVPCPFVWLSPNKISPKLVGSKDPFHWLNTRILEHLYFDWVITYIASWNKKLHYASNFLVRGPLDNLFKKIFFKLYDNAWEHDREVGSYLKGCF